MLCENCKQREANVRYSENINGVRKEMHLCEECSRELGITDNMKFDMGLNFSSLFGGIFEDFPMLKRMQGSNRHTGRLGEIPEKKVDIKKEIPKKEEVKEDKLNKLEKDLKEAIKEERYEDAAKIRDEIKKEEGDV